MDGTNFIMVHRSFWTSIDAGNTACNIVMSHSPIAVCTVQITIQVQLLPNHLSINLGAIFPHYLCCKYFVNRIPFTVVIFYLISPIPTLIAKRRGDDSSGYVQGKHAQLEVNGLIQVEPVPRTCLVPHNWHRGLSVCSPHSALPRPSCSE